MLNTKKIKELEAKHGKHNFCYQCGNPDIKPLGMPYPGGFHCPQCGSSDGDE